MNSMRLTGSPVEYKFIHKTCNELLETIEVHAQDQNELEAYCLLCEYTAYTARKVSMYLFQLRFLIPCIGWKLLRPIHSIHANSTPASPTPGET